MKVVATTGREKFLVEMTADEIAKVCTGERYYSSSRLPPIGVGHEFKVNDIFDRLKGLDANKNALSKMADSLRSMAQLLEAQEPVINGLTAEAEKPDDSEPA